MQHRVGRLNVAETSVVIVVARPIATTPSPPASTINRLKRIVPIWKKEVFEDGEVWVEGPVETVEVP
jgi:molybdopterin synthase catalytic subunit